MPGPLQPLDAGGVRAMRGLEISAAPERQPGDGRGPGPDDVVLVGRSVDRQLGVPEGGR